MPQYFGTGQTITEGWMKMTRTQPGRKCKQEGPTGQSLITTPQKQQTRPKPLKHEETEMRRHVMLIQKRNVTVKVKVYFIKKYQEKNTQVSGFVRFITGYRSSIWKCLEIYGSYPIKLSSFNAGQQTIWYCSSGSSWCSWPGPGPHWRPAARTASSAQVRHGEAVRHMEALSFWFVAVVLLRENVFHCLAWPE